MATTARRLIAFNPTYGYPEEVSDTDPVKLAMLTLTGIGGAGLDLGGNTILNVPDPVNPTDGANKRYVDQIATGIDAIDSCRALASTNVSSLSGLITVDSVALAAGDRVLLIGQTNQVNNGVWLVQSGAWTRPMDFPAGLKASGKHTFIESGDNIYGGNGYLCNTQKGADVVGTNNLTWIQFAGLGEVTAGNGLVKSSQNGNTISVLLASPSGLQFTSGALDTLLQPSGSLTKDATGLGVQLSGTTLSNTGSGLAVLGLPTKFTIAGSATDGNFTATAANTLTDGNTSYADNLHSHKSVISATQVSQIHTNGSAALAIGDPVYWSSTGNILARGDASALASSVIIGVAGGAIASNGTGNIIKRGIIPGVLSNATPGIPVYLAVGGGLTQVVPTAPGAVIIQCGVAVNSQDLEISISYIGRRSLSGA